MLGQNAVTACIITLGLSLVGSEKNKQKRAMMTVGTPESPTRQIRFGSTIEGWLVGPDSKWKLTEASGSFEAS